MVLFGTKKLTCNRDAQRLLAEGMRRHWGVEQLPEQHREERGKPWFPSAPQWQFNLSHSGSLALCALSQEPVGVDIQIIRPWKPKLLERVCTQEEREWLRSRGDGELDFALLWAVKESIGKQSGYGLPYPPSKLPVFVPEMGQAMTRTPLFQQSGLWVRVYPGEHWAAAACGVEPPPADIQWLED